MMPEAPAPELDEACVTEMQISMSVMLSTRLSWHGLDMLWPRPRSARDKNIKTIGLILAFSAY